MDPFLEKVLLYSVDLDELSKIRSEVREFLGEECADIVKGRIVFCLDEAMTNVIEHGFSEPNQSKIELRMKKNKRSWKFSILDEGIPFDPTKEKSETWKELYESGADGGFGLRSIKKIMVVRYQRLKNPPRNKLTLIHTRE
ncbi:ATP-binding protein [Leptospira langatensis]|uniref:ATP-binding protein n=1 Tax=Leptospira langatensis TaxID=2484983 RepID=A0A5F1ZST3_9LEPT|nr:ATP-binding protein [Leptospira langatensis]TGK02855.1 ATP-binding protein [Leptospira langatensis]TGL41609.1 ATP-binding protein [Leptospira langatensis]